MTYSLPKPVILFFLLSAALYLGLVSFIQYPLNTFLKPIPIACLIIGVLCCDVRSWAKIILVLALFFSLLGDIVLTMPIALTMELGIGCFFIAHCFYVVLFLKAFRFKLTAFLYSLPVLCAMGFLCFLIIPHTGMLFVPVLIYFSILLLVLFSAFQVKKNRFFIICGVLFFVSSDATLALNLFLYPQMDARIFIMLTYYIAQFLLTTGVVALYNKKQVMHKCREQAMVH